MRYSKNILFSHLDTIRAFPPSPIRHPTIYLKYLTTPFSEWEKKGFEQTHWFETEGTGYGAMHSTKPQTLAYSLASSPVGLLAWIYDKLHDWTDDYPWTADEVLTWISIYVFSRSGPHSSTFIYYEAQHKNPKLRDEIMSTYCPTPLGLGWFPKELQLVPHIWARTLGPVAWEKEYDHGGHFAAYEKPDDIVEGVRKTRIAIRI
jgi:hypothetical protein